MWQSVNHWHWRRRNFQAPVHFFIPHHIFMCVSGNGSFARVAVKWMDSNSAAAMTLVPCPWEWDPIPPTHPTLPPSLPNSLHYPTPPPITHTHTHIHPSSTLESIDKQHKQQRGDKQGDITKPSQQQDFGSRTIFQFNIPKQRGVNAAPQKKKKEKISSRVCLIYI